MKTKTFLSILGIVILISLFSMQGIGYCYKVMDTLAPGDAAETEDPEKLGSNTNAVDRAFNAGQRGKLASGNEVTGDTVLDVEGAQLASSGTLYELVAESKVMPYVFKEGYVLSNAEEVVTTIASLRQDQLPVILSTKDLSDDEVWETFLSGLSEVIRIAIEQGKIKVVTVEIDSPAFRAFEELFAAGDIIDFSQRFTSTDDMLKNQTVAEALKGAV